MAPATSQNLVERPITTPNALRYVPSCGSVSVSAHQDGSDVVILVTDTGAGIAAEDLPHVFDRFWRADKSRSRSTGGSGLGRAVELS